VDHFPSKFVNLHYSLLPNLAGTIGENTLRSAYEQGSIFSGATVHLVSEELDAGEQLAQVVLPRTFFTSFELFSAAVTLAGGLALVATLCTWKAEGASRAGLSFSGGRSKLVFPTLSNVELPELSVIVLTDFLSIYGKKSLWPEMLEGDQVTFK
jgi:hypothetical protein